VRIGSQKALPFLKKEGEPGHRPVIAGEVLDVVDPSWPHALKEDLSHVCQDPVGWAHLLLEEAGADLICLKLESAHPDAGAKGIPTSVDFFKSFLKSVTSPVVLLGCGDHEVDNHLLPACSQMAAGECLLIGDVVPDNYKTIAAACIADGHNIIAESPIDVNIAKQLNILLTDLGMPLDRIVINPTIGPLGYGLEYAYSIMERARLAALSGDKLLASPFICFVGEEAWRVKEAKSTQEEMPFWGNACDRGIMWEVTTAMAMLEAGADVITMRHPKAIRIVKDAIEVLRS
jgi:acetyl-CoA decarbonylase/synthase complex subunit delta